jgi:hypothetical protein
VAAPPPPLHPPTPPCPFHSRPQVIRSLLAPDKFVIVVEHDLSVLDYLSDFICCLYGKPGAYGEPSLISLQLWLADAAAVRCAGQLRAACKSTGGVGGRDVERG